MKLPLRQSITSPDVIMNAEGKRFAMKTPLTYGPTSPSYTAIYDAEGTVLFDIYGNWTLARDVVQACNAYPALLEACRAWATVLEWNTDTDDPEFPWANFEADYEAATKLTRAALAQVNTDD